MTLSLPYIWMYHSVTDYEDDPFKITVRPERLHRQMAWLKARGLQGVSAIELVKAMNKGKHSALVGLTFDDGYADFATEALPVLQYFGFTASVYIVTGHIGGENAWDHPGPIKHLMTAEQIRDVAGAGFEVGSHSRNHVSLPAATPEALATELRRSREELTEVVGTEIPGFVYPYGDIGPREVEAARTAGYDYACAIRPGSIAGLYALPRTFVGDQDSGLRLAAKRLRHARRRYAAVSSAAST